MGKLYIVGTPIGNLEDITLRALRVLKEADVIFCEDTRVTQRLLKHYDIVAKKLVTFNEQRSGVRVEQAITLLEDGANGALVTDAGMPGISDPGGVLVQAAVEAAIPVEVIPGPSALTSAIALAGMPITDFTFLGFLPHKKGRETLFKEIIQSERTMIFYESPHRILKTLQALQKHIREGDRTIILARELTKVFEEVLRGNATELIAQLENDTNKQRGEFVVIVSGK